LEVAAQLNSEGILALIGIEVVSPVQISTDGMFPTGNGFTKTVTLNIGLEQPLMMDVATTV
jgi:hypothetical protein